MIVIVDNGKGAEEISRLLKTKGKIIKPGEKADGSAYIITDGLEPKKVYDEIIKIVEKKLPVLAIGLGAFYIFEALGANIKKIKPSANEEKLTISTPSPLLLDFKKFFSVKADCVFESDGLPENFYDTASNASETTWLVQDVESPLFCMNFNPALSPDGVKLVRNFEKFIEIWEKYHK